jgi:hypothetical protein
VTPGTYLLAAALPYAIAGRGSAAVTVGYAQPGSGTGPGPNEPEGLQAGPAEVISLVHALPWRVRPPGHLPWRARAQPSL